MASSIDGITDISKLKINCSWQKEAELVRKCIVTNEDAGKYDISIDDFVSLDSCLCLMRENSTELPEITITLNDLSRVDIASDGLSINVCDEHKNIRKSLQSEFVDEWEGFGVYYTKYLVPENLTSITLKFTQMKDPDRLWIYGIRLQAGCGPSSTASNKLPAMQEFAKQFYALSTKGGERNTNNNCKNCDVKLEVIEKKLNTKIELMENNLKKFIVEEQQKLLNNIKDLLKKRHVLPTV